MSTVRLENIKVCLFDVYGTLFDMRSAFSQSGSLISDSTGMLLDKWRAKQIEYALLRTCMGYHVDFYKVTRDALEYAIYSLGIPSAGLGTRLMDAMMTLDPFPEAEAAVRQVKATGMKVGILSNGSPEMLESLIKHAGFDELFEYVLSAESVGAFKPHPSVYGLGPKHTHIAVNELVLVSANSWDVVGAAAFGYKTVWVNRRLQIREAMPWKADAVITDLSEFPQIIGANSHE